MKNLILFALVLVCMESSAQTAFSKSMGANTNIYDEFYSVTRSNDGGYVACGYGPGTTAQGSILVKVDSLGVLKWYKNFAGSSNEAINVYKISDEGYIVAGWDYNTSSGDFNPLLVRFDSLGNLKWKKTITGSVEITIYDVAEVHNGFVFCGRYSPTGTFGTSDAIVFKTDTGGTMVWCKRFAVSGVDDQALNIRVTYDKGLIVLGEALISTARPTLFKLDSMGTYKWGRQFSSASGSVLMGKSGMLACTKDSGYALTCKFPDASTTEIWLIKTDSLGAPQWSKKYSDGYSKTLAQTPDNGFILGGKGTFNSPLYGGFLMKTDSLGAFQWGNLYGDSTDILSVSTTPDGGFVAVGNKERAATYRDPWIIKTNSLGQAGSCNLSITTTVTNPTYTYTPSVSYGITNLSLTTTNMTFNANNYTPVQKNYCGFTTEIKYIPNEDDISVYPNPASNYLTISSRENSRIKIYDILGNHILSSATKENNHIINTESFSRGIYFIQIQTSTGISLRRFVLD